VAGMFYPADPRELRSLVDTYLGGGNAAGPVPKAVIAPHAGYPYSGPVAGSAYARVAPARGRIRRVVLLGPSHRVAFSGLAAPSAQGFATPLGTVPVDQAAIEQIRSLPQVKVLDAAHALEHSLEVHLPFLQQALGEFTLAPLAVGEATADEVADVLERLWGGPETLIVVSSDLSHYNPYRTAQRLDRATSDAIEQLAPDRIDYEQACGRIPVCGLLLAARRHGLRATTVDLRNSGDTAGPRNEVVGYGAYIFE